MLIFMFWKYIKKIKFFLFFSLFQMNIFLVFLDDFNVLISKIIFKNKKYYFDKFIKKK
jgi:hypothetical protein